MYIYIYIYIRHRALVAQGSVLIHHMLSQGCWIMDYRDPPPPACVELHGVACLRDFSIFQK